MAEPFNGKIGVTYRESTPWWPDPERTSADSPNVVMMMFDDLGFSHFGCYGSSIETPNADRLAAGGLRYNNFHTTALCSPTRACLMTGRNHHTVGMRSISNFDSGYPNCRGNITHHAATIAEMVREEGYATFCLGKWHLAQIQDSSAAGPFDQWPLGRGFDRFHGFLEGQTDQFYPELICDNHRVDPPCGPEEGYHLTEDLIDNAMQFIRDLKSVRPDRPYFLYLPFGAMHQPHQAPREFIEKYRGCFDAGWDVVRKEWHERQLAMGIIPRGTELAPLNPGVRPWDDMSDNEKKLAARLQEVFAGMLEHTDQQIGRLLDFLEQIGDMDNTIVLLLSDNGASKEGGEGGVLDESRQHADLVQHRLDDAGGPRSYTNIPWGWAQVGNTPLKRYKQDTFGGGIRDPLIIHYPPAIKDPGSIRQQFHHVSDITPTLLEMLAIEPRQSYCGYDQIPITGTSMVYTLEGAAEKSRKGPQYFENFGHRGIWNDGWKAVTYHTEGELFTDDEWELYHLDEDFSEYYNLASSKPAKLQEMIDLWWTEAGRHGVLPLDDRVGALFSISRFRHNMPNHRGNYVYYPPVTHIPAEVAPQLGFRRWFMTAEVKMPGPTDGGVILAMGTQTKGISWYIKDQHVVLDCNIATEHYVVRSSEMVPVGASTLGVSFMWQDSNGLLTVSINGQKCGAMELPARLNIGNIGLRIGSDNKSPVTDSYEPPFAFTGAIDKVVVRHPEYLTEADERAAAQARFIEEMARQ